MTWFDPVDLYCERVDLAFWGEPFNAISNLAFLLAAASAIAERRRRGLTDWPTLLLCLIAFTVGLGSFLFHTFANRWAELADIVPIWTFVTVYLVVCIMRLRRRQASARRVGMLVALALAAPALWILSSQATPAPAGLHDPFNGSLQYAPAVAALAGFALMLSRRRHSVASWIWAATAAFAVALVFRTVDLRLCTALATGTHFIWHLLDGLTVGLLLQAMLRLAPRA